MRLLKVVQINLHHCETASSELIKLLLDSGVDVALVQEPWINNNRVCGLRARGYTLFVPSTEEKVRTCILAKDELNFNLFHSFSNGDQTVVLKEAKGGKTLVMASVYLPYEAADPPDTALQELVEHSRRRSRYLILGCDANAHHSQWGSADINKRGESVFNFITNFNLVICNKGNTPTFSIRDREAVIDITLTNLAGDLIKDWRVDLGFHFSDHRLITFGIDFKGSAGKPFRNSRRADWASFRQLVDSKLEVVHDWDIPDRNIDTIVENFTVALNESFELSCPIIYPGKRKQPRWWTTELGIQRSAVRKLFNRAKYTGSDEDWSSYKVGFNKYKMDTKRAKRASWRNFCESVDSVNELSRFRRCLSKDPVAPGLIQRADSSWTESCSESLDLLMETHFPGCIDIESDYMTSGVNCIQRSISDEAASDCGLSSVRGNLWPESDTGNIDINEIISGDKVAWAVNTFGQFKSPGPDGIFPAMLQNVSDKVISFLVELFRVCLKSQCIPRRWREVRVIFIPKAGKATHSKPKDYRPISLSSFLLKTLERLIDLHLRTKLETRHISSAQHAYLRGKSVDSALHDVVSYVEKGLLHKEYTMAAFLDIEGAFNNIKIEAIKESLTLLNIQASLIGWITKMLESRVIYSSMGDTCLKKLATRGTPQGGVLSPLLWLLALNTILKSFDDRGWKIVAYADDVVLLVTGKFLPTISDVMQTRLRDLSLWASSKGLGINPGKTELVLFTRRYKVDSFRLPVLNGIELSLSKEAKYLGVYLDSKLSWNRNSQERVKRGLNAYHTCRNSIGKNWGLKPKVVYWIYTSVVRPILTYGCSVWWGAVRKDTHRSLLSKVQRCASTGITGALRSTPQAALDALLHLLPIEDYIKSKATQCLFRLKELNLIRNFSTGHASILNDVKFEGLSLSRSPPSDYIGTCLDFGATPDIVIPSRDLWDGVGKLYEGWAVFTDGSKMEVGTGAGVYLMGTDIKKSYRLSDSCSVFQAEILGIHKALGLVEAHLKANAEVTIYVDSQAALLALNGHVVRSRLVRACRNELRRLMDTYKIRLCWVPGHREIHGNETADELARGGSELDESLSEVSASTPIGVFLTAIRTWYLDRSNDTWKSRVDCRVSRTIWPRYNLHDTKLLLGLNRPCIRIMTGIITGHFFIGKMLNRWDRSISDLCRICEDAEETETIEHILCHCPGLQRNRLKRFGCHFLHELDEVASKGLDNLIGFVLGIRWLRDHREVR